MFDVLVCCYGDYIDIAKRCLDSVIDLSSQSLNIHVGLNECGLNTKKYCRDLLDNSKITTLIESNVNINKDPMMRKLIDCVSSEYFLWLDDDTFPTKKGWDNLILESLNKEYDVGGFTHVSNRNSYAGYKNFLEKRPWFNSWEKYKSYKDSNLQNDHIPFPIGFLWVGKTKYFLKHNFPDKYMVKKCDDMLLGEMIYQTDANFYHLGELWDYFDKNTSPRRGFGESEQDGWIQSTNTEEFDGLTIYPTGGMCNRIRNFVTAYVLCKEKKIPLRFIHETGSSLIAGIKFDDYWEIPKDIIYQNLSTNEIMKIHNKQLNSNNLYYRIPSNKINNIYHNHWGLCIQEHESCEKEGLERLTVGLKNSVLKLKDEWEHKINDFVQNNNINKCIGMHLRSFEFLFGERKPEQNTNMIKNFMDKIKNSSENIFLATDSKFVQEAIRSELGDRCIIFKEIYDEYLTRNYLEDFEHGLMDFYILSRCKKVYGTKGSSYSHLAGLISGEMEWVIGARDVREWEG